MENLKPFLLEFLLPMFLFIILAGILVLSTVFFCSKKGCEEYAETTGRMTEHKMFSGCYVQTKTEWLKMDEYRATIKPTLEIE